MEAAGAREVGCDAGVVLDGGGVAADASERKAGVGHLRAWGTVGTGEPGSGQRLPQLAPFRSRKSGVWRRPAALRGLELGTGVVARGRAEALSGEEEVAEAAARRCPRGWMRHGRST